MPDESGRTEIYVRPFPGSGGKQRISTEGGIRPEWSPDGRSLFYMSGDTLLRAPVDTAGAFSAGRPERLFSCGCYNESGRFYEIEPDGRQFLFIQNAEPVSPVTQIGVVLGWRGDLERQIREKQPR
jgi:hypothetical protein